MTANCGIDSPTAPTTHNIGSSQSPPLWADAMLGHASSTLTCLLTADCRLVSLDGD
jgi:hypothetical protein